MFQSESKRFQDSTWAKKDRHHFAPGTSNLRFDRESACASTPYPIVHLSSNEEGMARSPIGHLSSHEEGLRCTNTLRHQTLCVSQLFGLFPVELTRLGMFPED